MINRLTISWFTTAVQCTELQIAASNHPNIINPKMDHIKSTLYCSIYYHPKWQKYNNLFDFKIQLCVHI